MPESKAGRREGASGDTYRLELVGARAGEQRPPVVVQALDKNKAVIHSQPVRDDGSFSLPPDVLKKAHRIVVGAAGEKDAVLEGAAYFRTEEFISAARRGEIAIAEGIWSNWFFFWRCVSGNVRVCRRRPWWFESLFEAAITPVFKAAPSGNTRPPSIDRIGTLPAIRGLRPSLNDLIIWPYRCHVVCQGTVEVYRRTCCCWPIIIDDLRIDDLIRDLEIIVEQLPPIPVPPFPDPLETPFFRGGALNELMLNAPNDLRVLRSLTRDQAAQYINSRAYLIRRLCSCSAPSKVATGNINPDGSFNVCWFGPPDLLRSNCYAEYAYVVKQTIGGTTTTIYDGIAAGAWFSQGDHPTLTSYNVNAYTCDETGTGDGNAWVMLDLIGDTESHELTTPTSTGWDRVAAPNSSSGLLFPNPGAFGHLRNLGGSVELTLRFSDGMKDAAVGAHYYRISISRADANGNPTGPRYYYGQGLDNANDSLTWMKVVGADVVPDTLGPQPPVGANGEKYLYRIPYNDEAWIGQVRYHALINTRFAAINLPAEGDVSTPASNHLITVEIFNDLGERIRPLGTPASGQAGTEHAKAFKFRRWFQPGGSIGDDTVEVPFAALTHLFCWDNRLPQADITRLVKNGVASDAECQFLVGTTASTFGLEYRAYVPDERFQFRHGISWVRGLNASVANGGVGSLPTPLSPSNVGVPPAPPVNSGTNTFQQMLTRINPDSSVTVLERCSFAVTLTTHAKTTNGASFNYPFDTETAAFALEIE